MKRGMIFLLLSMLVLALLVSGCTETAGDAIMRLGRSTVIYQQMQPPAPAPAVAPPPTGITPATAGTLSAGSTDSGGALPSMSGVESATPSISTAGGGDSGTLPSPTGLSRPEVDIPCETVSRDVYCENGMLVTKIVQTCTRFTRQSCPSQKCEDGACVDTGTQCPPKSVVCANGILRTTTYTPVGTQCRPDVVTQPCLTQRCASNTACETPQQICPAPRRFCRTEGNLKQLVTVTYSGPDCAPTNTTANCPNTCAPSPVAANAFVCN
ncbi:hypothetical protein KY359_01745 [Candidatus Woesearchaeota archaeon]|nr:hypothetical protein [Candidatus Woesearchaeota archaeon]